MKSIPLTCLLLLTAWPLLAIAQDDTAHHRAVYDATTKAEPKLKKSKASLKDEELEWALQGWSEGDSLRKISASVPGEDGNGSEEYYIEDGKLLFVFKHYASAAAAGEKSAQMEDRYYFKDGKMFKWLDSEKKPVDAKSPDFASEAELLEGKFKSFVGAFKAKTSGAKTKEKAVATKTAEGVFTGIEEGDYMHWQMKTSDGKELSFFILSPDASVDKVLEKATSFIGKKCRVQWKKSTENIPEAGGKIEVEQVLSVEWLGGK